MALDPSVRTVMQRINKKSGAGTVVLGSQIVQPLRQTITSGSLNLDAALGGGWATNHWNEIIGWESAGKTYLVLKTIAANQKLDPDWTTVWFATEDFVESYATMLGVDIGRVIVENENTMEEIYEHAIDFLKTKGVDCIVIDSLPFLVSSREDDGTMEDTQPGFAALLTGKFFRKSQRSIKRSLIVEERPVTGFVINGWRHNFNKYGDNRTTPGGNGKNFVFFQRVEVKRDEWITDTKGNPVGQKMKLVNIKNKYARPGLVGHIDAYIADYKGHRAGQFDLVKDVVSAAIAYDVITKPDNLHYEFAGESWAGRPKLDIAIQEDRQLQRRLRKAVLTAASAPMPAPVESPRKRVSNAKAGKTPRVTKSGTSGSQEKDGKTTRRVGVRKSAARHAH